MVYTTTGTETTADQMTSLAPQETTAATGHETTTSEIATTMSLATSQSTSKSTFQTTVPMSTNLQTFQTTEEMSSNNEAKCSCICYNDTLTVDQKIEARRKELQIDPKGTSKEKNKLTCAADDRQSSQNIGYFGICILAVTILFPLLIDCMNICELKRHSYS